MTIFFIITSFLGFIVGFIFVASPFVLLIWGFHMANKKKFLIPLIISLSFIFLFLGRLFYIGMNPNVCYENWFCGAELFPHATFGFIVLIKIIFSFFLNKKNENKVTPS